MSRVAGWYFAEHAKADTQCIFCTAETEFLGTCTRFAKSGY